MFHNFVNEENILGAVSLCSVNMQVLILKFFSKAVVQVTCQWACTVNFLVSYMGQCNVEAS